MSDGSKLHDQFGKPWTEQQIRVIRHVGWGLSNHDIAEKMNLTESGVKSHLRDASARAGCRNRHELVDEAWKRGLLDPATPSPNHAAEKRWLYQAVDQLLETTPAMLNRLSRLSRAGVAPEIFLWAQEVTLILERMHEFTEELPPMSERGE